MTSFLPLVACTVVFASVDFTMVYEPGRSVIVQYGAPRSATTLQFEILKYVTSLVNLDVGLSRTDGGYVRSWKDFHPSQNAVYKSHSLRYFEEAMGNNSHPVMLFTTAETDDIREVDERVVYVQSKRQVEENALSVIDDYAKIFNLTLQQAEKTKAFIKVWDVWRLCCGLQQSLANRLVLHKCPPILTWFDPANPNCELYDLAKVDRLVEFSVSKEVAVNDFADLDKIFVSPQTSDEHSCLHYQEMIEGGRDFNGQKFTDCPTLIKQHVPHEYQNYVCRNEEYSELCKRS